MRRGRLGRLLGWASSQLAPVPQVEVQIQQLAHRRCRPGASFPCACIAPGPGPAAGSVLVTTSRNRMQSSNVL